MPATNERGSRSQDYRVFYSGPQTEPDPELGPRFSDKGPQNWRSSYASPDTAIREARSAARSRELRCPDSHVVVVDIRQETVLWAWDGPASPAGVLNGGQPVIFEAAR
jgi:hypothetical protein